MSTIQVVAALNTLAILEAMSPKTTSPILRALTALRKQYGATVDDSSSESTISFGWPDEDEEVEPLPRSVYSDSPPRAPTPPLSMIEDFDRDWTDNEPTHLAISSDRSMDDESEARRSSQHWEEHTVMDPEFLAADWSDSDFPTFHKPFATNYPCLKPWSFANWAKNWRNDRSYKDMDWIVPNGIFKTVTPQLVRYPGGNHNQFFCQKVISNAINYPSVNPFKERLSEDLFLHSKTSIPLVPTGKPLDIQAEFIAELVFEPTCQYFTFTIMDESEGRKLRVEICIFDQDIQINTMVNPRRINHPSNESHLWDHDGRRGYWDIEGPEF